MPLNEIGLVRNGAQGLTAGANAVATIDPSGALVVMDFFAKAMLDGRGYQVRSGTITTPLVGAVAISATAAEFCIDPPVGYTDFPVQQFISVRLSTGTLHEYATKSVTGASSAGTAFVCLPILTGASGNMTASATTARVQSAGNVTVTTELATTTRRHWSWSNPAAGFTGALPGDQHQEWAPLRPPPIRSQTGAAWCLYTQIAATGTGPSYYASLDFLEFTNASLGIV